MFVGWFEKTLIMVGKYLAAKNVKAGQQICWGWLGTEIDDFVMMKLHQVKTFNYVWSNKKRQFESGRNWLVINWKS